MGRVDVNATQYHQGLQLQEDQGSNHPPPPQAAPPQSTVPPPREEIQPPPPSANQYYQPPPSPPPAANQTYPPPPLPSHHVTAESTNRAAVNNNPWSSVLPSTSNQTHDDHHKETPRSSTSSEEDKPKIFPPPQQFHHEEDATKPPHDQVENMPRAFPPPPPPAQNDYHNYNINTADSYEKPQAFPPPQHQYEEEETPQAFPPPQQQNTTAQFVHQFPPPQSAPSPLQQSAFPQPQQQPNAFVGGVSVMGQPQQFIQQPQIQMNRPFVNPNVAVVGTQFLQPQLQIQPWSSSLFDCMNDPQNAIITACFPCVTFGQIAEIVDAGGTSCGTSGMMYGCIAFLIAMPCLVSCGYRTKLRSKFGLIESPAPDWIVHCFCEWCALCQEYRELQARGLDPAIGWVGNVAKQMQQQQQVHMTPPMQQRMM